MSCWINTVSADHVRLGVQGGFTQAGHGAGTGLAKLSRGDIIAFYSPQTELEGGESLQAFTAMGRVADDRAYQVEVSADFKPFRRRVEFFPAQPAPIRPLIKDLTFITDPFRWGLPFRKGLFEIERSDLKIIAKAMKMDLSGLDNPQQ